MEKKIRKKILKIVEGKKMKQEKEINPNWIYICVVGCLP